MKLSGVAGTTALAGCSGVLSGGNGSSAASFTDWLYEPGTVSDVDHYLALRYSPATVSEHASALNDDVYDAMRAFGSSARDLVGLNFDATTDHLAFGKNSVMAGEYETERVVDTLEDEQFTAEGSYGEFDVYLGPDADRAVGVEKSNLVLSRSSGIFGTGDDAEAILQAIVDAKAGDAERYVEDNDDLDRLLSTLGDGDLQSARTHGETGSTDTDEGKFRGEVARGVTSSFVDEGVESTFALVFTEAADVDANDLEDWVEANQGDGPFANWETTDVSTDGRVGLVSGVEDTADYDFYLTSL